MTQDRPAALTTNMRTAFRAVPAPAILTAVITALAAAAPALATITPTGSVQVAPAQTSLPPSTGDQNLPNDNQIVITGSTSSLIVDAGSVLTVGGIATTLQTLTSIGTGDNITPQSVLPAPEFVVTGTGSRVVLTGFRTVDTNGIVISDGPRILVGNAGNVRVLAGATIDASGPAAQGAQGDVIIGATIGADALLEIDGVGSVFQAPQRLIVGDDSAFGTFSTFQSVLTVTNGGRLDANELILSNGIDNPLLLPSLESGNLFATTLASGSVFGGGAVINATSLRLGANPYSDASFEVGAGGNLNVGSGGAVIGGRGIEATGSLLISDGGVANIAANLDVSPLTQGPTPTNPPPVTPGAGVVEIGAGGTLNVAGALRVFGGGSVFGSTGLDINNQALPDGILRANTLELHEGGIIDDTHLEFQNIDTFLLKPGAIFATAGDALVGLNASGGVRGAVGTVSADGANISLAGNLGVGVGTTNVGNLNLGAFSSLSVNGSAQIGTATGLGRVNLVTGSSMTLFSTAGASDLEIGSTGLLNVDSGSRVDVLGDLRVTGGQVNVTSGGQILSLQLLANGGGMINAGGLRISQFGAIELAADGIGLGPEPGLDAPFSAPPEVTLSGAGTVMNLNGDQQITDLETGDVLGAVDRLIISGSGQINILDGAVLNANVAPVLGSTANTIIGDRLGSDALVTVSGAGSTLRTASQLIIGNDHGGSAPTTVPAPRPQLQILAAGRVESQRAIVSAGVDNPDVTDPAATTSAQVIVEGIGSVWTAQKLDIGAFDRGLGEVQVTNGGRLEVGTGGLLVGNGGSDPLAATSGILSVDNGTVRVVTDRSQIAPIKIGFGYTGPATLEQPNGVLQLNNGSAFNVDALDADGRMLVGFEGAGQVNVLGGSRLAINGQGPEVTGTLNGGLIIGVVDTGDAFARGVVDVDGVGSELQITHTGSTARLWVGSGPSDSTYTGLASVEGSLAVTNGGVVRVSGIGQRSRILVGEGLRSAGSILVSGVGSRLEMTGTDNVMIIGTGLAIDASTVGASVGEVVIADRAVLDIGSSAAGTRSAVTVGQQSSVGRLTIDNATANVAGDIVVSAARLGTHTNIFQIGGGSAVTATGTTRVGAGGLLTGFQTFDDTDTVRADGFLSTQQLVLEAGGEINTTHLELRNVQQFDLLSGAVFNTSRVASIGGPSIKNFAANNAIVGLFNGLEIGNGAGTDGDVFLTGTSSVVISGGAKIGTNGGIGLASIGQGSSVQMLETFVGGRIGVAGNDIGAQAILNEALVSEATENLIIGSGGQVSVAGELDVAGRTLVDGGKLFVESTGIARTGGLAVDNGGLVDAEFISIANAEPLIGGLPSTLYVTGDSLSADVVLAGAGSRLSALRELEVGTRDGTNASLVVGNSAEVIVGDLGLEIGAGSGSGTVNVTTNGIVNVLATDSNTALQVSSSFGSGASTTSASRLLLSQEARFSIVAGAGGNGTAIIGDGGFGALSVDSGANFLLNATGSSTARLVIGSRTGDDNGEAIALVGGGTSALTVQSTATTARLDIGTCASSLCTGTGFARGEMSVFDGAIVTVAGIGQAAEVTLASATNTSGLLVLTGAGSQMDIRGTSAQLLIGGPGTAGGGEAGAAAVVSVVDGAILNVGATGTSTGTVEVGKGTNGGKLSATAGTINVAGDINVASAPSAGVNGSGTLAVNGGARVTATGTTRLFAGSTLTGSPECTDVCLEDGVLETRFLELYAGGQIFDDHLEIFGVEEFRAFAGAQYSTSFDALIGGPAVKRVIASDALLTLGGDLGIGAGSGTEGFTTIAGAEGQMDVSGRLGVGVFGGTGTLNLLDGASVRVFGQTSGPVANATIINPTAVVGSGGRINVGGAGTVLQVSGGLDVDGGRIDVTDGGELIATIAGVGNSGTINATASRVTIGDALAIGGGTGSTGSIVIDDGSLLRVFGDLQIGTDGGTGSLVLRGESNAEINTGEIAADLLFGSGGTLEVLVGSSFEVSGDIALNGGLLNVGSGSDIFANSLTAGSGGRITGSGRLNLSGGLIAGPDASLAPGNSPGLLTVNGDVTIDGGSLIIEMAGSNPGQFDVLRVEGDFAFNSGAFKLSLLNDFEPISNSEFRVIEARDSLTVNTENVTFGYVGMGPDYQFSIRDFDLSNGSVSQTYRGGFVSFVAQDIAPLPGLTENEQSLAVALDELCPQVEGISDPTSDEEDLDRICGGLRSSQNTEEQVQDGLDALAPEEITGAVNSLLRYTTVQHGNLSQRINGLRYGAKPIDFGGLNLQFEDHYIAGKDLERFLTDLVGGAASADEDFARWGFFGNGSFSKGDKDATENESGFGFDGAILTLGADYRLRDDLFVGGAFGFNDLTADFDTGGGLEFQSISGSLFGTWLYQDAGYVDALVTWGSSDSETRRRIVYDDAIGLVDRTAEGDTEGTVMLASVSGGWDFERAALVYGPHIGVNFSESQVDGFEETGAEGANLAIPDQETRSLTANLGVHASYTLTPSFGVLIPHVRLDWVREFEDDAETINVRFLSDRFSEDPTNPTSPFAVATDAPDADYLSWSVGASAQFINGIAAFVNYRGNALQKDTQVGELTLGIRMEKSF